MRPGAPADGDRLGCSHGCSAQIEGRHASGAPALHGVSLPVQHRISCRIHDRGSRLLDAPLDVLRTEGSRGHSEEHADDGQRREPAGSPISQGCDRQGKADDQQARAPADQDDAREGRSFVGAAHQGNHVALGGCVHRREDGGKHEEDEAGDGQADASGHRARPVGGRGRGTPDPGRGPARGRRPAGAGGTRRGRAVSAPLAARARRGSAGGYSGGESRVCLTWSRTRARCSCGVISWGALSEAG